MICRTDGNGLSPADRLLALLVSARVFGVTTLVSVCIFWQNSFLLTLILAALSCTVLIGRRNRQDLIVFLICGSFGAIAETLVVAFGAWSYAVPQFLGIPYWLPLVWGLSALFIKNISARIDNLTQTTQAS